MRCFCGNAIYFKGPKVEVVEGGVKKVCHKCGRIHRKDFGPKYFTSYKGKTNSGMGVETMIKQDVRKLFTPDKRIVVHEQIIAYCHDVAEYWDGNRPAPPTLHLSMPTGGLLTLMVPKEKSTEVYAMVREFLTTVLLRIGGDKATATQKTVNAILTR